MPDNNYYEVIPVDTRGVPEGKFSAIKMKSGPVHLCIEEWITGMPDPTDSELGEAVIVLDLEQFRSFLRWGMEVAG
jgi:hypothetical protein